jgi:hypothetical protein
MPYHDFGHSQLIGQGAAFQWLSVIGWEEEIPHKASSSRGIGGWSKGQEQ